MNWKALTCCVSLLTAGCSTTSSAQALVPSKSDTYDASIVGPIDGDSLSPSLLAIQATALFGGGTVKLLLDTPGGNAIAMMEWITEVNNAKKSGVVIECTVDFIAASAGAMILETVCDKRMAVPNALILFHEAATTAKGKQDELEDNVKFMKVLNKAIAVLVGPRIGMTPLQYLAWVAGHDRWLGADEALKMGVIDSIVPNSKTPQAAIQK